MWELYSSTSQALAEGSSNILDGSQKIEEIRLNVQEKLQTPGLSKPAIDALWDSLPKNVFLRYSEDQLEWAASAVLSAPSDETVLVAVREVEQQGVSELLVYTRDYDGLVAAVTVVIDEIGLDVLSARVMNTSSEFSFDLFQLMDQHGQALNEIDIERLKTRLLEVLDERIVPVPVVRKLPRRLRPFKSSARIRFSAARGGEMTLMDLECTDRPGLLSQISVVMLSGGIRIHDARITTLGDRVEDAFIISDQNNAPLSPQMRTSLRKALIGTLGDR